jgi:hypothetical protein
MGGSGLRDKVNLQFKMRNSSLSWVLAIIASFVDAKDRAVSSLSRGSIL